MDLFERKSCKQCGCKLGIFSRQRFCSEQCVSVWDKNKRECEELRKKNMIKELNKIREYRERQKYEELKKKYSN